MKNVREETAYLKAWGEPGPGRLAMVVVARG